MLCKFRNQFVLFAPIVKSLQTASFLARHIFKGFLCLRLTLFSRCVFSEYLTLHSKMSGDDKRKWQFRNVF